MNDVNIILKNKYDIKLLPYYIYFLIDKNSIVYVGQSRNIHTRIKNHKKDKKFDSYFYVKSHDKSEIDKLEKYYINRFKPYYNDSLINSYINISNQKINQLFQNGKEFLIKNKKIEYKSDFSNTNKSKLINDFIISKNIRENSKNNYRKGLKQFFLWVQDHGVMEPQRADILKYKQDLIQRQLSAYTVNFYLGTIYRFFEWLEVNEVFPNITKKIENVKKPKKNCRNSLFEDQAIKLLDSVDTSSLIGKRNYAMITLMLFTGLRVCEVQRANIEDIHNTNGQTILYVQGKGHDSKDDFVVLDSFVVSAVNNYLTARKYVKNGDSLFCGHGNRNRSRLTTIVISKTVKKYLRAIGLNNPKLSADSLRLFKFNISKYNITKKLQRKIKKLKE